MLLFKKAFHAGLLDGTITLTFRRWTTSRVRPGGRYRCHPLGVLEVDAVERVTAESITDEDARRAGFDSRAAVIAYLEELGPLTPDTEVFRVSLHHGGDGDRVPLALEDALDERAIVEIRDQLRKLDTKKAWTRQTLDIIARQPRVAASRLASELGRDTAEFKADVVKLKKLGLTQSFEVGYELSPRGRAFCAQATADAALLEGASPSRRARSA